MATVRDRPLPSRVNPLMVGPDAPSYQELVDRRRLGQTDLTVRTSQVGTSSATQPENLGKFDYAHLRVSIPETRNGIWGPKGSPTSYFLMRRSSDGYISATGMFKAAFPWAEVDDEESERHYITSLPTTSSDQTAGNVWIPPTYALQLAEEYGITQWITAMLDNKKIETNNTKDQPPKAISPPPKFLLPQASLAAPTPSRVNRSLRSASPSKIASPRKTGPTPRKTKAASKAGSTDSHTKAANKSLQQALKQAATAGESDVSTPEPSEPRASVAPEDTPNGVEKEDVGVKNEDVNGEAAAEEPKVIVTVEKNVEVKDEVETTKTHVEVEMPVGFPELPLPEDGAAMIAKAKEMVDAANLKEEAARKAASVEVSLPRRSKLAAKAARKAPNGELSLSKSFKRKADELEEDDDAESGADYGSIVAPAPKKAKIETELKKEKVKTRALIGISATLAIGAMIPYISTLF